MKKNSIKVKRSHILELEVFSFAILYFLISLSISKLKQSGDTEVYLAEAQKIKELGVFPNGNQTWLSTFHNYLYPFTLHLLESIGLGSRFWVVFFQVGLAFLSVLFTRKVFAVAFGIRVKTVQRVLWLALLLPVISNSGYHLTEGFAIPCILVYISLIVCLTRNDYSENRWRFVWDLSTFNLFSGLIWMIRPQLFWVGVLSIPITIFLLLFNCKNCIKRFQTSVFSLLLSISILTVVVAPQVLIARPHQTAINALFHFDDLKGVIRGERSMYRYYSNLTGCGPSPIIFSPYAQTYEGALNNPINDSLAARINKFVSTLVSGWDTYPQPITYITNSGFSFWSLTSFLPGFFILSCVRFIKMSMKVKLIRGSHKDVWKYSLASLFIVSQLQLGLTHGEYRYNLFGLILSIVFSISYFPRNNFSDVRKDASKILGLNLLIFLAGQTTISLSNIWLECIR